MHIAALVSGTNKCKWANVSYVAKELNAQNWGWRSVKGTCGGRAFILGPNAAKSCRGLRASVKVSTATVEVAPLALREGRVGRAAGVSILKLVARHLQ